MLFLFFPLVGIRVGGSGIPCHIHEGHVRSLESSTDWIVGWALVISSVLGSNPTRDLVFFVVEGLCALKRNLQLQKNKFE